MYDFTNVDPVKCCTWLVLPTVYDESLSYGEQLNKFCKALNELIENNNNIPDYVSEMIQNYITSGAIDEVVRNILASYILNVKYPPKGISPAVGDGSADDTDAIQGCIDYAFNQGGGCVYLPYGKYLSRSLTLRSGVSLVGFDRYSTKIVQRGGDTKPLVSGGNVQNVQIANLTLDGNNEVQTDDLDVVNVLGKDVLLTNLVIKSGYQCLVYNGLGGDLQVSNVVFGGAVKKVAVINGKDSVQFENVKFNELGKIQGECVLEVGASDGVYRFSSKAVAPICIISNGSRNSFECDVINSTDNYVDNGSMNNFNILGVEVKEQLAKGKSSSVGGSVTESVSGSKTETITENKNENITGNREIDIDGTDSVHIDGVSSLNAGGDRTEVYGGSLSIGVTGVNMEEYHDNMNETFHSKHNVNGSDETNTFTGNIVNTANKFSFISKEKSLPIVFADKTVDIHNIDCRGTLEFEEIRTEIMYPNDNTFYLQAIDSSDNEIYVLRSGNNGTNITVYSYNLTAINRQKNLTYTHLNDICFYNNSLYVVDNSIDYILVLNPKTLEVTGTIPFTQVVGITHDATNFVIITTSSSKYGFSLIKCDNSFNVLSYKPISVYTKHGVNQISLAYYNNRYYAPMSAPSYMAVFNEQLELEYVYNYEQYTAHHLLQESDGICAYRNGILMGFNTPLNQTITGVENNLVYSDLRRGNSSKTNRIFGYYAPTAAITLNVDKTATNIVQDGSSDNPFHEIAQALNSFLYSSAPRWIHVVSGTDFIRVDAANIAFTLNTSSQTTINGIHLINASLNLSNNFKVTELTDRSGVGIWLEFGSTALIQPTDIVAVEAGTSSLATLTSTDIPFKQSNGVISYPSVNYASQYKTGSAGAFLGKSLFYQGKVSSTLNFNTVPGRYCLKYMQLSSNTLGSIINAWNNNTTTFTKLTSTELYIISYTIAQTSDTTHSVSRVGKKFTFSSNTWSNYDDNSEVLTLFGII